MTLNPGTMGEHVGLEFTEVGEDFIKATLPVDHRTQQPYGLLHGGAPVCWQRPRVPRKCDGWITTST